MKHFGEVAKHVAGRSSQEQAGVDEAGDLRMHVDRGDDGAPST